MQRGKSERCIIEEACTLVRLPRQDVGCLLDRTDLFSLWPFLRKRNSQSGQSPIPASEVHPLCSRGAIVREPSRRRRGGEPGEVEEDGIEKELCTYIHAGMYVQRYIYFTCTCPCVHSEEK